MLPPGCSFHPRCPLVDDRCRRGEAPPLLGVDDRRVACPPSVEQLAATRGTR
jgi:ABC-type dipeptide/oligopeptide/nickel transport system ATPase component